MTITDHQINSVIKTYMKSMKIKTACRDKNTDDLMRKDEMNISREAVKKVIYNRIGERVTEKLKKNER